MRVPENFKGLDELDLDPRTFSHEELSKIGGTATKWRCCVLGCNGYATVKDYSILPYVYWRKRWLDLTTMVFYCSKHAKKYKVELRRKEYFQVSEGYKPGTG